MIKLKKGISVLIIISFILISIPLQTLSAEKPDYFTVTEVTSDIYRFEERIDVEMEMPDPMNPGNTIIVQFYYRVNLYVVEQDDGLILVDSGVERNLNSKAKTPWSLLELQIKRTFKNKPILAVLLTHGHKDHADGARRLQENGVTIYASKVSMGMDWDWDLIELGNNLPGVPPQFIYEGYTPDAEYSDLPLGFGFTVIDTPGHTLGSVCLTYESNDGVNVIFSGDTIMPRFEDDDPDPMDLTWEINYGTLQGVVSDPMLKGLYLMTLSDLYARAELFEFEIICPGHNRPYYSAEDIKTLIDATIFWMNNPPPIPS
jgi:glyoxylase-like metal-dependent hydrolase (beta-lactamase superfamily II)